jgi:hypothetical protein
VTDPWAQARSDLSAAVGEREALQLDLATRQQDELALRRKAAEANAQGDLETSTSLLADASTAAQNIKDLSVKASSDASALLRKLAEELGEQDIDLEADVPLALLPVRLETRSMPGGAVLRVRIYPDSLAITNIDTGVSDQEAVAGAAYWKARTDAEAAGDPVAADTAWLTLLTAVGTRRAGITAAATKDAGAGGPRRIRRTVVRTLPDRFIVIAEQGGAGNETVSRGHGSAIPDELAAGVLEGESIDPTLTGLLAGESKWLVDYDAAKDVGLGVDLKLEQPGVTIRRLIAFGVRNTLDPDASAARLTELLRSHQLAGQAAVLTPGLATNNTETAPAGRDSTVKPPPPLATAPPGEGAGAELESALGVGAGTLIDFPGSDRGWEAPASAMANVLWPATWEAYLAHRLGEAGGTKPVLSRSSRELLRRHGTDAVRGLGPLPAIRLGKQPYGILPVTSTTDGYAGDGSFVEDGLWGFLQRIRPLWQGAAAALATVADADLETALPRILGTLPVSTGVRVRSVTSNGPGMKTIGINVVEQQTAAQALADQLCSLLMEVDPTKLEPTGLLGSRTRILGLPLTADSDPDVLARLSNGDPTDPPESVFQALVMISAAELDSHRGKLIGDLEAVGQLVPRELAGNLNLPADELRKTLEQIVRGEDDPGRTAELGSMVQRAVGPFNADLHAARFPVAALRPPALEALPLISTQLQDRARLQLLGAFLEVRTREHAFHSALELLAKESTTTTAQRALLLSSTLDTTSHRLDAWLTSLATRRLRELRSSRPTGVLLGAYGWVENLAIDPPPQADPGTVLPDPADLPGGYVHAPGLAHASTAAVLRSGRLSAIRRGSKAFDLDLSSTRVRQARALLEGVGRGQSIGALLGYRFERHLLTNGAERWVYPIRALAPIRSGKLTDAGAPSESVAASEVVDGVQLVELSTADLLAKATAWRPTPGDTYLDPASWDAMAAAERTAITGAHALITDLRDAAADLLLAESVHALVEGAPARAAAAADAIAAGEAAPPDLALLRSDRSGVAMTHRLVVLLDEGAAAAGYAPTRPRAQAEPRLERWLQQQLGPAENIVLTESGPQALPVTLADAGICALDVVLGAAEGGMGTVGLDAETPLTSTLRKVAGGPLLTTRPAGWESADPRLAIGEVWELARVLAGVLASARPVEAADLGRPDGAGAQGRVADLNDLADRVGKIRDDLTAAIQDLTDAVGQDVRDQLEQIAGYGIGPGWIPPPKPDPDSDLAALGVAANAAVTTAKARLAAAAPAISTAGDPTTSAAIATAAWRRAAEDLMGPGFPLLPVLAEGSPEGSPPDLFSAALAAPVLTKIQLVTKLRPWLLRVASVRPAIARWTQTLLYRDALQRGPILRVAQLPNGASTAWVGGAMTSAEMPTAPAASIIVEAPDAADSYAHTVLSGFVVDTWVDTVAKQRVLRTTVTPDEVDPPPEPVATTAVAVNANAPNNEAPQAILLAVSPDRQRWDSDRLVAVLHDTMDLLRLRGVTLETLPWAGRLLPATYVRDWSLQGEQTIDPRFLFEAISDVTPHFVIGD